MFINKRAGRSSALVIAVLLFAMLFVSGCSSSRAIAVVNGQRITRADLESYKKVLLLTNPNIEDMLKDNERRQALEKELMENLVHLELSKQSALDLGLSVSEEEIDEAYADASDYMVMVLGSEEEYKKRADEVKLKDSDFRNLIGDSLYSEKLLEHFAGEVTDEEIKELIAEYPSILMIAERVDVSHILVETEEEAIAARERLVDGEDLTVSLWLRPMRWLWMKSLNPSKLSLVGTLFICITVFRNRNILLMKSENLLLRVWLRKSGSCICIPCRKRATFSG